MLGIIGAGNMAGALARGWGEPVLATDGGSGRAARLVAEIGGEALTDNAELVRRADTIILGCQPHQLPDIAAKVDAGGKQVFSVLGPTTMAELRALFPDSTVARIMPNTPVELRKGVSCIAEGGEANRAVSELLAKALGVPKARVKLLSGATSRLKQVAVDGDPAKLGDTLRRLTVAQETKDRK